MADRPEVPEWMVLRIGSVLTALSRCREEAAWVGTRWRVGQATVAHVYGGDDQRLRITFRAEPDEVMAFENLGDPYFRAGWGRNVVGLLLDDDTDWAELSELLTDSYRLQAPRRLAALVGQPVSASRSVLGVSADPYELERFVEAQAGGVHEQALAELRAGRKTSHWMWFVFPQVAGLGSSPTSQHYAIGSLAEARAYLAHPVLGPRLVECAGAVLAHADRTAREIMGSPDDAKLRSSMTLFARADASEPVFEQVLEAFFDGAHDPRTSELLDG